MSLNIPDRARSAFAGNMQTGGAVELPFVAPAFFWVNGDAKLMSLGNFQFFGGWAVSAEKLQLATESWENLQFPIPGLQEAMTALDNGQSMTVYGSRSLYVAPIGMREYSSVLENGQQRRVAPFTPGGRPGIQVLAVLGYKNPDGSIFHWAPVLLTARGYQVNHLKKAIKSWQKSIEPVIKRMIPDTDPSAISNLFWMSVGTFGKERKAEMVGTTNKKPITPIGSFIPENITEDLLTKLYVGSDLAEWMADLAEQAKEWLQVFQLLEQPARRNQPAESAPPEAPPFPEDEIPF